MIPFPGESLGLWDAKAGAGTGADLTPFITYRDGATTLAAGDDWRVSVTSAWADYLEEGDPTPVTVSWVVEVLSGSVTVTASEGLTNDLTGATPTGLGSHTLTAGTNVIPSTLTASDVLGLGTGEDMLLRLAATSGSAVVQQVKMRVWPTAGVAGAWSDPYPPYSATNAANVDMPADYRMMSASAAGAPGTAAALWETVKAEIQAHRDEVFTGALQAGSDPAGQLITQTYAFDGIVLDSEVTWLLGQVPYVYASRPAALNPKIDPALGLEDGVDYIRPPEEVFGDDTRNILATDPVGIAWDSDTATVQTIHDADGGGGMFVAVQALPEGGRVGDVVTFTWPDTAASAVNGTTLALPDSDELIFTATHTLIVDDVPLTVGTVVDQWRFIIGNGEYTWTGESPGWVPLSYEATFPAYQVWNPAAVPAETVYPLRLIRRGDGLGMGSGRVLSTGTRQNSTRVFGVL